RAIALAPENPLLHRALAVLALSQPEPAVSVALGAGREAVRRDSGLLPDLVDEFLALDLSEEQWVALVPDSALDRLQLAVLLEQPGLAAEARQAVRRAAERASPGDAPLVRWMLARLLSRVGDTASALVELDAAAGQDPDDPELDLARASALAVRG